VRAQFYKATEMEGTGPGAAYWRFRAWTVPVTLLIGGLLGGAALLAPNDITAESNIFLRDPRGSLVLGTGGSGSTELARYAKQRAEFAQSERVLGDAAEELGDKTIEEMREQVTVRATPSSNLLVTCRAATQERAVDICDAVVDAYRATSLADSQSQSDAARQVLLDQREALLADPDIDPQANALDEIDLRIADLAVSTTLFDDGVEFTTGPEAFEVSLIRPIIQYGIAGLLFGALASAGLAWALANRRPVAGSSRDVANVLGVPVLGEVESRSLSKKNADGVPSGEFQLLATGLAALDATGVLATSSPHRLDALPRMVAELALATARDGRTVLVIDGDGADRQLGSILGVPDQRPGLTDVLEGTVSVQRAVVSRQVGTGQVDVLGAGQQVDDPATMLRSKAARDLIAGARQRYNLVFVNAAPLLDHAEGPSFASQSDGVILFVSAGTEVSDLQVVRDWLEVVRTPLLGVVYDRSGL
jgi:Mrp family chromosome partitioning ATPase